VEKLMALVVPLTRVDAATEVRSSISADGKTGVFAISLGI
jgi:hypothetical protein